MMCLSQLTVPMFLFPNDVGQELLSRFGFSEL